MVPQEWTTVIMALRRAQVARECIQNHVATQQMRDDAILTFGRALDDIYFALDAMMEAGVLSRIQWLLNMKGRG